MPHVLGHFLGIAQMEHTPGYDTFMPATGAPCPVDACRVCARPLVKTGASILGPTGFVEAVAGRSHWHDVWTCPLIDSPTHQLLLRLLQEESRLVSPRLKAIVAEDILDLRIQLTTEEESDGVAAHS